MCRTLLLSGDFFLGGVVAATLAKLVLRLRALGGGGGPGALNRTAAEAMLVGAAILRLGGSKAITHAIDDDSQDRIASALRVRQPQEPVALRARGTCFIIEIPLVLMRCGRMWCHNGCAR